jgi:hypothetical protein
MGLKPRIVEALIYLHAGLSRAKQLVDGRHE